MSGTRCSTAIDHPAIRDAGQSVRCDGKARLQFNRKGAPMGRNLRWATCGLLTLNLLGIAVSLWSLVVGPWPELRCLGVIGFGVGACLGISLGRGESAREAFGLVGDPRLAAAVHKWMFRMNKVLLATACVGLCGTILGAGMGRSNLELPLLTYVLTNPGQKIEISRLRNALAAASFFIFWHAAAAMMSLSVLQYLLTGSWPWPPSTRFRSRVQR
jgi:hypothetical protein